MFVKTGQASNIKMKISIVNKKQITSTYAKIQSLLYLFQTIEVTENCFNFCLEVEE
jgi:hypothetical protein